MLRGNSKTRNRTGDSLSCRAKRWKLTSENIERKCASIVHKTRKKDKKLMRTRRYVSPLTNTKTKLNLTKLFYSVISRQLIILQI